MQARGAGPIDGQPSHEHQAGLRTRALDDGNARQARLESLGNEPRQKPAHQAMFEMDLDDLGRIAPVRQSRRLEGDGADRHFLAPFVDALAPFARTHAQVIERILPACLLGEGQVIGIELERGDLAYRFGARGVERQTGSREGGAHDALQVVRIDTYALT